jgi:hypothetical protein
MDTKLVGGYQLCNFLLKGKSYDLLICKRKKPSQGKSALFLLQIKNGIKSYLSSLYIQSVENCNKIYQLEVEGLNYQLDLDECKSVASINSMNTINNMELGVKSTPNGLGIENPQNSDNAAI